MEFLKRALHGLPPVIYGDGEQTRDFIHVRDAVSAIVKAMESEGARGVYNIGSGEAISINRLAETVLKVLSIDSIKPIHQQPRKGDIKHSHADIARASRDLGFKPTVKLEEGIRELAAVLRQEARRQPNT